MKLNDICLFVSTILHSEYITLGPLGMGAKEERFKNQVIGYCNTSWVKETIDRSIHP